MVRLDFGYDFKQFDDAAAKVPAGSMVAAAALFEGERTPNVPDGTAR